MRKVVQTMFILVSLTMKSQIVYTVAGNGIQGFSGDGGPASSSQVSSIAGIVVDKNGGVIFADGNRIRKVNKFGIINTIAGNVTPGFSGDGGPASSAYFTFPNGISLDTAGNLYIIDDINERIRKIDASGIITTIAGTGIQGFSGDGSTATIANINVSSGITVDKSGNIFFCDNSSRIRKVDISGIISTIAGNGVPGFSGDGGAALLAQLNNPTDICIDGNNNLYIADFGNKRVRKINSSGVITTIAGTGIGGISGTGGPATSANIDARYIASDQSGNIILSELGGYIRKINLAGTLSLISSVGTTTCSNANGISPFSTCLSGDKLSFDNLGNIYFGVNSPSNIGQIVRVICFNNCFLNINVLSAVQYRQALIYPNPNNGSFSIEMSDSISENHFELFNIFGQKVLEQKISNDRNKIITTNLASGLYNYLIHHNNLEVSKGKLIIE